MLEGSNERHWSEAGAFPFSVPGAGHYPGKEQESSSGSFQERKWLLFLKAG